MSAIESQVGRHIRQHDSELALAISQRLRSHPPLARTNDPERDSEKILKFVDHLAQALAVGEPVLFAEHVSEAAKGLAGRDVGLAPVRDLLEAADQVLRALLSAAHWGVARPYLASALQLLQSPLQTPDEAAMSMSEAARRYLGCVVARNRMGARLVIRESLNAGKPAESIYLEILQPAQRQMGRLWRAGRVSVALEHFCTGVSMSMMARAMEHAAPSPPNPGRRRAFVGVAVAGEYHDLGLRMVCDLLELDGWDVFFLGASTPHDAAIGEAVACGATVVGISATMLTHVDRAAELVRAVRMDPRCAGMKTMVGGRPFELAPSLWQKIGADGMAADARGAVVQANRLIRLSEKH